MSKKRGNSNKNNSYSKEKLRIIVLLVIVIFLIILASSLVLSNKSDNQNFIGKLFSNKGGSNNNRVYYCDKDHDGYISNSRSGSCRGTTCIPSGCTTTPGTDCNDLNANAWIYKSFYTDNDHDSFGTGSLINVCSNGYPSLGYSTNNLDCNDNNLNMNPNVAEVCTNGIDDNCNGLTDSNDPACQTQCSPTKSCTDYPNQCGYNLNDGCNNVLDCSNNCPTNYSCSAGVCINSPPNINAITCNDLMISNCIEINDAWLSSQGSSPYYLNKTGATYLLMKDVNTIGTAFVINADNITFNINTHTITYDDSSPIAITNSDFENEIGKSITGWDFSKAPNFEVKKGTYVQPVSQFSGSNSIFISSPCPDQSITSNTFTLEPNTYYVISANILNDGEENPDEYKSVLLYVMIDGTNNNVSNTYCDPDTHLCTTTVIWRRASHMYTVFKTGPTRETHYIIAGIKNASGMIYPRNLYIDNIKITRYDAFGVLIGATSWMTPGTFGDANVQDAGINYVKNTLVKNGNIVQGKDKGERSSAIVLGTNYNKNIEISNTKTSVSGPNSKNIEYLGDSNSFVENVSIHDNTLYNNVTMIRNRMSYDGVMMGLGIFSNTKIYNNILFGGSHMGLVVNNKEPSKPNYIYNNKITLYSRYTNDFAIGPGDNAFVYNNIVDCGDGDKSCRGIFVNANDNIYNNTVKVQELLRNQEYNGCEYMGAYGMQAEASKNSNVYKNDITAVANICEAHAYRANPLDEAGGGYNVSVHDNTFTGISNISNNIIGSSIMIENGNDSALNISNNLLIANRNWIYFDMWSNINLTFRGNIFQMLSNVGSDVRPVATNNYYDSPINLSFIDNTYKDLTTENYFKNSNMIDCGPYGSYCINAIDTHGSIYSYWTFNLNVLNSGTSVNGATVTIKNNLGNQVYSGTTSNGKISTILSEFLNYAGSKTNYNSYSYTINDNSGHTCTKTLTITKPTTQTIDLSNCIIS